MSPIVLRNKQEHQNLTKHRLIAFLLFPLPAGSWVFGPAVFMFPCSPLCFRRTLTTMHVWRLLRVTLYQSYQKLINKPVFTLSVLKYAASQHNKLIIFEGKPAKITHTHQHLQNQGTYKHRPIWLNNFFSQWWTFQLIASGSKVYKFHWWPHCGLWDACLWHPVHKQMTVAGNEWWECSCECGGCDCGLILLLDINIDIIITVKTYLYKQDSNDIEAC